MPRAVFILAFAVAAMASPVPPRLLSIRVEPQRVLRGSHVSQQLLVIGTFSDSSEQDVTDLAQWSLSDPSLARIEGGARLLVIRDGLLTLTATVQGCTASSSLRIEQTQ